MDIMKLKSYEDIVECFKRGNLIKYKYQELTRLGESYNNRSKNKSSKIRKRCNRKKKQKSMVSAYIFMTCL